MEGIGKNYYAHELLKMDFVQILEEAKRQEDIHPSNKGELDVAMKILEFFSQSVYPLIKTEKLIFEAVEDLVSNYLKTHFHIFRLNGERTHNWQQNKLATDKEVLDMLAKMHLAGKSPLAGKENLVKASDFIGLILVNELTTTEMKEVFDLHERIVDHEDLQLTITLKNIAEMYEIGFPRLMFVIKRILKHMNGENESMSDGKLLQPSDYLDWFSKMADEKNALYPIIGNQKMQIFLKTTRNVVSHHIGFQWDRNKNVVILEDKLKTLEVPLYIFQQRHRYLVYWIDYGMRAILAAFCEVDNGVKANKVYKEYEKRSLKILPKDIHLVQGVV